MKSINYDLDYLGTKGHKTLNRLDHDPNDHDAVIDLHSLYGEGYNPLN